MKLSDERGVALLTVLLLVAVMAVMAASVLDEIRFAVRRTANAEAVGQARWYALGAEAFARAQIARLPQEALTSGAWNGRTASLPVEGGTIQARITDGGGCFNLNSVVSGPPELLRRDDRGAAQFIRLAEVLGLAAREAELLAAALVDWIDSDPLRETGGAEDDAYGRTGEGYLTGGALLAEPSELRAIRGFTPAVYARLRPFVCALPTTGPSIVNVNTLPPEKAALVAMLAAVPMTEPAARRLIEARPPGGWSDPAEFLGLPAVVAAEVSGDQVSVRPRFYHLETEVMLSDADVVSTALFENFSGQLRLAARRWGPEE